MFGRSWKRVASWHTHPSKDHRRVDFGFSGPDKNWANHFDEPFYKTDDRGKTARWDPSEDQYSPESNGQDTSGTGHDTGF